MSGVARLLFPAVRWDAGARDWDADEDRRGRLAGRGVGGWIVFGGPTSAVAELTAGLRAASPHPILIGADLERGAGQQFTGATPLPPAAALAALDDPEVTRRAGELTGREAMALGVDWVYAPVADLDIEPDNPIVGTRAFGADPAGAAGHAAAWVDGCRGAGAMACAKHFPGHGRTTADSHTALPVVDAAAAALESDLEPFRACIAAGVDAVMTAHVAFPALDPDAVAATLSRPILTGLLRDRMGFDGLVVTDALIMEGARGGEESGAAAVRAVAAGCDALLYPDHPEAAAAALDDARGAALPERRLEDALRRIRDAAAAASRRRTDAPAGPVSDAVGRPEDRAWALELAGRSMRAVRGTPSAAAAVELVTIDDDAGGPYPAPARAALAAGLRAATVDVAEVDAPGGGAAVVVAVYADIRGFKGRSGLSDEAAAAVRAAVEGAPAATVVVFGHPRTAAGVPGENVLCAWGGEPLMQEAAALRLALGAGR